MLLYKYLKYSMNILNKWIIKDGYNIFFGCHTSGGATMNTIDNAVDIVWREHYKEDFPNLNYDEEEKESFDELINELKETLRFKYIKGYSSSKYDDAKLLLNIMLTI